MRKIFFLILTLFLTCAESFALEIVYPKTNPAKINTSSAFFIGSISPSSKSTDVLKINDVEVKVSEKGAFAQVVPLNVGVNNFKIISGADTIDFVIERTQPQSASVVPPSLIEYPIMSNFFVKTENAPLRSTPVNAGINRLSHLSQDVQLSVNGEKGDFYRVYLNSKLNAWILKSDVEQREICQCQNSPSVLNKFKVKEENDYCLYEFDLQRKVPFTLKEENGLNLQLYNIAEQEDCTYLLNIPMPKLFGYEAYYDKDKFFLKVRKAPKVIVEKPLHDIVIAVDAGHGGTEFGAIGGCGDKEKDINLAISKNLHKELEKRGAKVVMTRVEDVNVSLGDRVKFAKEKDAMLLVSVHANALPDGADPINNKGTSVYYYQNQAKPLAESILCEMTTQLGTQNDKVRQGSLALVRPTSSISVLIEVAYIINPDDYALLTDKDFQEKCAKAIADGIEKFILK